MAFTALGGPVPPVGWWLFGATVLWALIYDTQYAMVDRDDDIAVGVKSTALLFGRWDRLAIAVMQIALVALLGWIGLMAGRGGWYFAGLAGAAALAVYQQVLIRDRARNACFQAFLNNNYFGMLVFAGLVLDYLSQGPH
jgi:4-hydroxybenzoate polyprenyltransferase